MTDMFKQYERQVTLGELRPYVPGEDLSKISVEVGYTPQEGDWIARDPQNRDNQWLVSRTYFKSHYKPDPV